MPTTYGKRSLKRKNNTETRRDAAGLLSTAIADDDGLPIQPPAAHKKRRTSPAHEEEVSPAPSGLKYSYATPKKMPRLSPTGTSSKPALSSLSPDGPTTPSRTNSPTKLAKRMLARSKTETAVVSESIPFSFGDKRTPSLPNLPSSQIQSSLSPSRTNTLMNVSGSSSITLPAPPALGSSSVSRTYAGKSRSYLLPSVSTTGMNADGNIDDFEDEFSRESYTSLRQRWGVDQSEDDPYVDTDVHTPNSSRPPSPSKPRTYGGKGTRSASTTPHSSPSKTHNREDGRGKNRLGTQQRAPPLPPGMMNPLKSITELRNKGESRRFLDEVAYLLDGMSKTQGVSLIRASALEMVTKLCDGEFFRKAKAADVFAKVYDLFIEVGIGRGDKILDTLFLFYIVLISKDLPSLGELAYHVADIPPTSNAKGKGKAATQESHRSLVDILFSILDTACTNSSDPLVLVAPSFQNGAATSGDAELRKAGLGKKEKLTITTILLMIKNKSGVFLMSTKIRTPLLITHILHSLSPSLISQHHLPNLLNSLRENLQPLQAWSTSESNVVDSNLDSDIDWENVFAHLRLLDLYLLGQWAPHEVFASQSEDADNDISSSNDAALLAARKMWLVDGLVALGIHAEVALRCDGVEYDGAAKCLESVLRVLVSVTHADEAWARSVVLENTQTLPFLMRIVAKSGEEVDIGRVDTVMSVKKDGSEGVSPREKKAQSLDRLCLSLALLTNLVQGLDDVKDLIRETYLDPTCSMHKSSCPDACSCSGKSALEVLVQLYVRQSVDSKQEDGEDEERLQLDADASFLRGHLAILFGLFMQGNAATQRALLDLLPGSSATQSHGEMKIKLSRLVEQARQFAAFFAVVVGQQEGRKVEKEVAKAVVKFLEDLRDRVVE